MTDPTISEVGSQLARLTKEIRTAGPRRAKKLWGGAHVVILDAAPEPTRDGLGSEHRYVTTDYALELSWLFERLRVEFDPMIDPVTKFEFYGRLANAANAYKAAVDVQSARDLVDSVLLEAFAMLDEMDRGEFQALSVAIGNEIAADRRGDSVYPGAAEASRLLAEYEMRFAKPTT